MKPRITLAQTFVWLVVLFFQFIMTQGVLLLLSLLFPVTDNILETQPLLFLFIVWLCWTAGAFLVGWLAVAKGWLNIPTQYLQRLMGTLIGALIPLLAALIFYHPLEPGNPMYFIAMATAVLGFYLPDLVRRKSA